MQYLVFSVHFKTGHALRATTSLFLRAMSRELFKISFYDYCARFKHL